MLGGVLNHITIGSRQVLRCPECVIDSVRNRPLSRIRIVLPDADGSLYRSIRAGEAVRVALGLRGQSPSTWTGTVLDVAAGNTIDQIVVNVAGPGLAISATRIVQSWVDERPEAIVRWAVGRAGLAAGRIDAPGVTLPHFAAGDIPVWQVARQCAVSCRRAFGVDMRRWALWMGADGRVNWGDFDEPGDIPQIASGKNLIAHAPSEAPYGLCRVETFLLPGLRHSRLFRLIDARRGVDAQFRALRVRHFIRPNRVRTVIWYGEEYAQC